MNTNTTQPESRWSSILDTTSLMHPDRSWLQNLPKTVCPLDHLGLLRVSGPQAEEFLNNLVSCKLEPQNKQPQLCSLCNPKGRVLSCFIVFYKDDSLYLQMPHEMVAATMQRLKMYVLATKVEITDVSADLLGIGYIGVAPTKANNDVTAFKAVGHLPRYFIYADASRIQTLWQQAIADGYSATAHNAWHYADIGCGIPNIYLPTSEKLTPQMINLDLLGGVSFTKGCYPGQEVVARTHYLGKLKRRSYLCYAETDAIKAGDSVYHSDSSEPCGVVVDDYAVDTNYSLCFISIRINALDTLELYIKAQDRLPITLHIEKMPYSVKQTSHGSET